MFEITLQQAWKQPEATLAQWFTRYGTRRYGLTDTSAVAAWQLLGSTIYSGNGGGFGSAISSVPKLVGPPAPPAPQPVGPPAPKGYTRSHPTDGYWNSPPPEIPNTSVDKCAEICTSLTPPGYPGVKCVAFEVYINTPPDTGNCYTFTSTAGTFTALQGTRTYLRDLGRGDNRTTTVAPMQPHTIAGQAKLAQLSESYTEGKPASRTETFQQAWALLLQASDTLGKIPSFHFDLVDIGREVIAANFSATFSAYSIAFTKGDAKGCAGLEAELMSTIDDYDKLLSTDTNFMLGRWLKWARSWGDDADAKANLEYNARNQLTLWGPTGQINDYAKKEWGGLVRSYYKARYQLLFKMANESLQKQYQWDQSRYAQALLTQVELPWQTENTSYPTAPESDVIATSKAMKVKYG